jgi:hypothetical protein
MPFWEKPNLQKQIRRINCGGLERLSKRKSAFSFRNISA